MIHTVKNFPIFHRYLASILLKVGLAEGSYSHILETVGEYTVTGRCECGNETDEETCNTMYMESDSLVGRDGTYCHGFNIGYIIFSFYKDGFFQLESLADRPEENFPFFQEIRDVLAGRSVSYDEGYAERVVEEFVEGLEKVDTVRVSV